MNELKAAILGAGFMGQTHYKNLQQINDVKVVAVCDSNKEQAFTLAEKGIQVKAYTDFDIMLLSESIDMLFVCLPPFAHNGEVEKAAQKGIAIFIEKPIALTTGRAKSMVDAIEKNNIISQVGYHQRFGGAVKKLKKMIDEGDAGKPCLFDAQYACNSLHSQWWRDANKSGSQILEQVIHTYDMAIYLLGVPQYVLGMMSNVCHKEIDNYSIEDVSASILKFENEAIASICATNCAVPMCWENPFIAVFEKVTVKFRDPNNAEFIYTENEVNSQTVSFDCNMYLEEIKEFVRCIKENGQTSCSIKDGYISLDLVNTVVNSAKFNEIKFKNIL